jgi:hypothetical protein
LGKYLICHTDGENLGLMDALTESGMDIADSVCPSPLTKLKLEDYRRSFQNRITIWGGVPSTAVLKDILSDREFDAYMDDLFTQIGDGRRLILSIADTTPPAASFDRIEHIAKMCRQFGPVK